MNNDNEYNQIIKALNNFEYAPSIRELADVLKIHPDTLKARIVEIKLIQNIEHKIELLQTKKGFVVLKRKNE